MNKLAELKARENEVNALWNEAQRLEKVGEASDGAFMQWNTAWTALGDFKMANRSELRNLKIELILGDQGE